jgi:hypothetical protein
MKVSDKLAKVDNSFTINMYDNGFMVEIGGRNEDDDWATARIMVSDIDSLLAVVKEAAGMKRD